MGVYQSVGGEYKKTRINKSLIVTTDLRSLIKWTHI